MNDFTDAELLAELQRRGLLRHRMEAQAQQDASGNTVWQQLVEWWETPQRAVTDRPWPEELKLQFGVDR